jgi:hypothetical protein
LVNRSCSRLSESADMTPWEVIEEALAHMRPVRSLQWLADEIKVSIQVVVNWRTRGVPPRRYRDVAAALGITIDQLEGVEPLPWERLEEAPAGLLPEVADVAAIINALPPKQRAWVLKTARDAIGLAAETMAVNEESVGAEPAPVQRKRTAR